MDKYITIADFGSYAVVEPAGSENTLSITDQAAEICHRRAARSRKIREDREAVVSATAGGILVAATLILMVGSWLLGIG